MAYFNLPTKSMNLTFLTGVGSVGILGVSYAYRHVLPPPIHVFLAQTAVVGATVSLASTEALHEKSVGIFGKGKDGRIPWLRWLMFWPFHAAVTVVMRGYRLSTTEPLYSRIENGWYLGGCPTRDAELPFGPAPALLDVTCEMPRVVDAVAYKLLPSWETHGLNPDQIEDGVQWALEQKEAGRSVLAYCTHGHGRSAVLVAAILIADGLAGSVEEARRKVQQARPGARPNKRQWQALREWYEQHGRRRGRGKRKGVDR